MADVVPSQSHEKWATALALSVLLSGTIFGVLSVFSFSWFLFRHSTLPEELAQFFTTTNLALSFTFDHPFLFFTTVMEHQARQALDLIKNTNVLLDTKLDFLGKLKANIKHQNVPELAISVCFEVVRSTISTLQLHDIGFSILSHLTKRLLLQAQRSILATQGRLIYSCLVDRLGDAKDRVRTRAIQALADFWPVSPDAVEELVKDTALASRNPRTKEAAMEWVTKVC